jgi:iron only hydrogenase large subunit-like protein
MPLINVDAGKCNNCHSCISVCPVKSCLDGSGDRIAIIEERCLGCGQCITACTSRARSVIDDTEAFFDALDADEPVVAIAAPSAITVFDDIFRMIGFLKSRGVLAVFDVSFGAELAVRSYLEYARKERPKIIISQACAAIVSYCELYAPHLLQYLAPVHSPMLHTAIMIKNFYPEYAGAKIAAISPCTAKKREFEETGLVDFNVTMTGLKNYIERKFIDLSDFAPCDFCGPMAERAVSFSSPGGLRATVLRDALALAGKIRRVEGVSTVYKYLNDIPGMLEDGNAPFLVDCLSCSSGCNGGPGTPNFGRPVDALENKIDERLKYHTRRNKRIPGMNLIKGAVNKFWKPGLYSRGYQDRGGSLSGYRTPTEKDLDIIYYKMKKTGPSDFLNCAACGYGSCRGMAEAIFNGLNRPENCHHYLKKEVDEQLQEHKSILEYVRDGIFLLDSGLRILPSYSKALEEIFRRDMLAALPVMDVFSGFLGKETLTEIEVFLDRAFDISVTDSEIQNDNPLREAEACFANLDGDFDRHNLRFAIERIGDEKTIQKLLVMVRDTGGNFDCNAAESGKIVPPDPVMKEIEDRLGRFSGNVMLKQALLTLAVRCMEFRAGDDGNGAERITFDARYAGDDLYVSCRFAKPGGGTNFSEEAAWRFCETGVSRIKDKLKFLSCRKVQFEAKKDCCRLNLVFPKAQAAELAITKPNFE